jgi:hypothetical protein
MQNVLSYIRERRNLYETEEIPVFEGYMYSQYQTINQIDKYWVDSYLEDAHDDVIGDFPFDNISKFRVLLEARATDFDFKNFEVEPEDGSRTARVSAMIATKALKRHMRDINASKFLNDFCITRPKYGGVLVENTKDGTFVIPWQNLITDQSNIMAGVRIKRDYLTPSELLRKKDVWKNVKEAVKTAQSWREKDIEGSSSDRAKTQGDLIEIFEIQGDIQLAMLKHAQALMNDEVYEENEDDEYEYVSAKIIACGADWVDKDKKENGIILYAEEEETTQKYLARNPINGIGLGEGVVQSLFEHQKWHNFTKTEEMRMIAIAGKKLYWTDDPDILSNIFDEGVDHGTVLRVSQGRTLAELNQLPTGVPIYQNIRQEWADSADKQTSSFNSKIGEEAKSGTPFRAQYLQNIEASSQFEQYREEIGIFFGEIATDWWLPDALKKAASDDEIFDTFTPQELQLIDEVIAEEAAIRELVKNTIAGKVMTNEQLDLVRNEARTMLAKEGNRRTIKDIQEFIRNAKGKVIVHTTDEQRNKAVYFESLGNALALLAPEDPRRNALIDRIMEAIGISKEELEIYVSQAPLMPNPNPQIQTTAMQQQNATAAERAIA